MSQIQNSSFTDGETDSVRSGSKNLQKVRGCSLVIVQLPSKQVSGFNPQHEGEGKKNKNQKPQTPPSTEVEVLGVSCNRIVTASLRHILEGTQARCDFLQLPCFPPVTEVAKTLVWLATTATLSPGGQGERNLKSPWDHRTETSSK